jgi:hypothetical protein
MRIVGSITTIPDRISLIEAVLDSILSQTRPLDCLYLNIPNISKKGKQYRIPEFLKIKNLVLNRCEDYGPITKLLPVLDIETDPDTYIVTFDDDRIVHRDVVKIIEKKIAKYPKHVLSFSGWNMGSFPFYLERYDDNTEDIEVDWVQGCHSITYPRSCVNKKRIINCFITAPSFLSRHDDHKISAYLERNKVKKISIGADAEKHFISAPCCKTDAISGGDSIWGKVKYFTQVLYIVNYFSSLNLYHRTYKNFYRTTTAKIMIVVTIAIAVFLIAFKMYRMKVR